MLKLITYITERKLLKETIWSFLSKAIPFPFFLLTNIVLARQLNPELYGQWSVLYSFITILVLISQFGLDNSARKKIAEYRNQEELGDILKHSFILRFFLSILFVSILLIIKVPLLQKFHYFQFDPIFNAAIIFIFLTNIVEFLKDVFQGLHRIKFNFIINVFEYITKLIFLIVGFYVSTSLFSVLFAFNIALLVTTVAGLIILVFAFYPQLKIHSKKLFYREILYYSAPLFFINIGFALATEIDTVLLATLRGNTEAGVFSVAKQLVNKLPHISFALSMGTMPIFAHITKDNRESLQEKFSTLVKINTLIFLCISIIICLTSWFWLPALYGEAYKGAIVPLLLLMPYLLFFSYSALANTFLDYQNKAHKRALHLIAILVVNIILNVLFIPPFGAAGAAIATSLAYVPYTILNWREIKNVWLQFSK